MKREEIFKYLDKVRNSGVINMFQCKELLLSQFPELSSKEATDLLVDWMKNFGERHLKSKPRVVRVEGNIDDDPILANWLHPKKKRRKG